MTTLIAGSEASFTVSVLADGKPLRVSGAVTARVFSMNGRTQIIPEFDLVETPDWSEGEVEVSLSDTQTQILPPGDVMLVLSGKFGIRRYRLLVETLTAPVRTSLFIKDIVVDEMRSEQLMAAAAGVLQDVEISDSYIWNKVRAAESEIAHRLRVPLVPTRYFPTQPTQEQIDALDGMAWEVEVGYDYQPENFDSGKWGMIITRQKPLISVERLRFSMPSASASYFDLPADWLKIDAKAGVIRILPTSNASLVTSSVLGMSALSWRSVIPAMIQLEYTAGLSDVENRFPELVDVIKKSAVCKIVNDAYLPQSGSISADGLSQSLAVDAAKYQEGIDHIIDGPAGSNGGLRSKIHGITAMVI